MRSFPWVVLAIGACAEPEVQVENAALTDSQLVELEAPDVPFEPDDLDTGYAFDEQAPDASIDRIRGSVAPPVMLSGTAWDPESGADVSCWLTSDLDGEVWLGRPLADGTWETSADLSEGQHLLRLLVEDPVGNLSAVERIVNVDIPNEAPDCWILTPGDGDTFDEDESVWMEATATDPEGADVDLLWTSDVQGPLFYGESWGARLDPGEHVLTLDGDDGEGGTCTDSVVITVR